jgi:hypothetical protein
VFFLSNGALCITRYHGDPARNNYVFTYPTGHRYVSGPSVASWDCTNENRAAFCSNLHKIAGVREGAIAGVDDYETWQCRGHPLV